jgi:hypothetical protein
MFLFIYLFIFFFLRDLCLFKHIVFLRFSRNVHTYSFIICVVHSLWKFGFNTEQSRSARRGGDSPKNSAKISTKYGGRALQSVSKKKKKVNKILKRI